MLNTQAQLVSKLVSGGVLQTKEIISAFRNIDRADFVRKEDLDKVYFDHPLPIGFDQTISQPFTVAFMFELLAPQKGEKILDVGSGSGWTTALLAKVVGPSGEVTGTEIVPELVNFGKSNLNKYGYKWAEIVETKHSLGFQDKAPFDRILVSAAAEELPIELVDQLKEGGVMVAPIKDAIWRIIKNKDSVVEVEKYEGFEFVPLKKQARM